MGCAQVSSLQLACAPLDWAALEERHQGGRGREGGLGGSIGGGEEHVAPRTCLRWRQLPSSGEYSQSVVFSRTRNGRDGYGTSTHTFDIGRARETPSCAASCSHRLRKFLTTVYVSCCCVYSSTRPGYKAELLSWTPEYCTSTSINSYVCAR